MTVEQEIQDIRTRVGNDMMVSALEHGYDMSQDQGLLAALVDDAMHQVERVVDQREEVQAALKLSQSLLHTGEQMLTRILGLMKQTALELGQRYDSVIPYEDVPELVRGLIEESSTPF